MKITKAKLIHYRNYKEEEFSFPSDLEFILGRNAQGKTNLLEAIYLACIGKAFRARTSREAFFDRKEAFHVELFFLEGERENHFVYTHKDKLPKLSVNRLPIERRSELFGLFPMVLFSPEHMRMVREGPAYRRTFFDREISLVSRSYFHKLIRYQKLLRSRNILLKEQFDPFQMDVYEEKMAQYAKSIYEKRKTFVERLEEKSAEIHSFLSGGKEKLTLTYKSSLQDVEEIGKRYKEDREKDKALGYTSFGPQSDDMQIEINGKDARRFASQGQARIASLSIFFGLIPFIEEEVEKKPIILLDDVFSELDRFRRHQLLDLLKNHQILLTSTDLDGLDLRRLGEFHTSIIEEGRKLQDEQSS